jgi:hypothetical protein
VGPIGGLAVTLSARLYSLALGGKAPLPRPTSVLASVLSLLTPRSFPALVYSAVTLALAGLAACEALRLCDCPRHCACVTALGTAPV